MIAFAMVLAMGLADEAPAQKVPLWSRFETSIVNSQSYANPFTDVTLVATFTCPDKSKVSFWGFCDGDGLAFGFIRIMNDFLGGLSYWRLRLDHALVNSGSLCLADPGQEYVVYRQTGGTISINLPGGGAAFRAEWLDPRTGDRKIAAAVDGGATRTFACPDARDWVLHLRCGE
jgi:hypothetical protein